MGNKRQAILIFGMHRSGTSMIASVVHMLGQSFGTRLQPPNDENPKGFFENVDIIRLNDEILQSMDVAWDSLGFIWDVDFSDAKFDKFRIKAKALLVKEFSDCPDIAIKDPRLCILAAFWCEILEEYGFSIRYLVVIRNPLECAHSQARRHNKDPDFHVIGRYPEQVLLLWYTYLRKALMNIGSIPAMLVSYEKLVSEPHIGIARIAAFIGSRLADEEEKKYANSLICRDLKRNFSSMEELQQVEPEGKFISQLFSGLVKLEKSDAPLNTEKLDTLLSATPALSHLLPLYLRQTEHLHSMAYYTGISLRHRLISTIHQLADWQASNQQLRCNAGELEAKINDLNQQLSESSQQVSALNQQMSELLQHAQVAELRYSEIINSRTWRWTAFIRKWVK